MMTDFPYEEPVPVVEPWLVMAAFALLALGALAGWLISQRYARPRDNADAIWKAIDDAVKAAMKAHDGVLLGEARNLEAVIQRRLGHTLTVAKGLSSRLKPLSEALANTPPPAPPLGPTGPAGPALQVSTPHGAMTPGSTPVGPGLVDPNTGSGAAATANLTIVTVANPQTTAAPAPSPPPPSPPPPAPSAREQIQAVRLAVADLNQHWMDRADRVAELRRAYAELSGR